MTTKPTAGTGDEAGSWNDASEARPEALTSLWPAILSHHKERLFCNGHNTEGSHITSRCTCRKAQQTLAEKFSQGRVA